MNALVQKILRVINFFKPENLKRQTIFATYADAAHLCRTDDVAVLVIDVQKRYCDPKCPAIHRDPTDGIRGTEETKNIAARIKSIIPAFREAGLSIWPVYYRHGSVRLSGRPDAYLFEPLETEDICIFKNDDSAFKGSDIHRQLKKSKKTHLLVCGFNLSACVHDTVIDARQKGYEVSLMLDLTGNDKVNGQDLERLQSMRRKNIRVIHSEDALKELRNNSCTL